MQAKLTSANVLTFARPEGRAQVIVWDVQTTFGLGVLIGAKVRSVHLPATGGKLTHR